MFSRFGRSILRIRSGLFLLYSLCVCLQSVLFSTIWYAESWPRLRRQGFFPRSFWWIDTPTQRAYPVILYYLLLTALHGFSPCGDEKRWWCVIPGYFYSKLYSTPSSRFGVLMWQIYRQTLSFIIVIYSLPLLLENHWTLHFDVNL